MLQNKASCEGPAAANLACSPAARNAAHAMRLLLLLAAAAAKTKYDVVDRDDATTFGILIDAGSTGSRVHIYQWEKRDFNTLPPPLSLPLTSERWTERIKPGLSDYNDDAERAARTSVPVGKSKFHGAFACSTAWRCRCTRRTG